MSKFIAADILVPAASVIGRWPVIACDQYTSQPEYWAGLRAAIGDAPSTLNLILPEAELLPDNTQRLDAIHGTMARYAADSFLEEHKASFVYVERTLVSGAIRPGIVGCVDLEHYDYRAGSTSAIRATEQTVTERIPPRRCLRQGSALDLSHILMLADDHRDLLLAPLKQDKTGLEALYDMDLPGGGGHIAGWLVRGGAARALEARILCYEAEMAEKAAAAGEEPVLYVIGDGNHSLAAAKDCYELAKAQGRDTAALRYALVELENLHDPALEFEPIHRLVEGPDPEALLEALTAACGAPEGHAIRCFPGAGERTLYIDPARAELALTVLQPALDACADRLGGTIDYIHGDDTVRALALQKGALGLQLPPIRKDGFFRSILTNGVLPRKTFSMGHAQEKRYYLETRRL